MDEVLLAEMTKLATNVVGLVKICGILAQRVKEQELRIQTLEQAAEMEKRTVH